MSRKPITRENAPSGAPATFSPESFGTDSPTTMYLLTSLTSGSSAIITATSRLEHLLKSHKIPFKAVDVATDDKARMLWGRRGKGRRLPGLVRDGLVLGNFEELEEWNEYGELKQNLGIAKPKKKKKDKSTADSATPVLDGTTSSTTPMRTAKPNIATEEKEGDGTPTGGIPTAFTQVAQAAAQAAKDMKKKSLKSVTAEKPAEEKKKSTEEKMAEEKKEEEKEAEEKAEEKKAEAKAETEAMEGLEKKREIAFAGDVNPAETKAEEPEETKVEVPEEKKEELSEEKKVEVPEEKKADVPEEKKEDAPEEKKEDVPEAKEVSAPEEPISEPPPPESIAAAEAPAEPSTRPSKPEPEEATEGESTAVETAPVPISAEKEELEEIAAEIKEMGQGDHDEVIKLIEEKAPAEEKPGNPPSTPAVSEEKPAVGEDK